MHYVNTGTTYVHVIFYLFCFHSLGLTGTCGKCLMRPYEWVRWLHGRERSVRRTSGWRTTRCLPTHLSSTPWGWHSRTLLFGRMWKSERSWHGIGLDICPWCGRSLRTEQSWTPMRMPTDLIYVVPFHNMYGVRHTVCIDNENIPLKWRWKALSVVLPMVMGTINSKYM